ncbi:MAG: hypothetical protein RLT05_01300 [Bauldia litoralis]
MHNNVEKVIHIEWDGPFSNDNITELVGPSDYGVYQIYGTHPIYGAGVLLYIGSASSQYFGARIRQHNWVTWCQDPMKISIYIGRLGGYERVSDDEWDRRIVQAERLLIYTHSPAFNSQNIRTIRPEDVEDIRVFNWDSYRSLFPEVSGGRWTDKFTDKHWRIYAEGEMK